jgi:hypothetical protein
LLLLLGIHINETTIGSSVSAVSVEDVFSSQYDSYKIILQTSETTASASNITVSLRLRVSGTDASGANYANIGYVSETGGSLARNTNNTQTALLSLGRIRQSAEQNSYAIIEINSPFAARHTTFLYQVFGQDQSLGLTNFGQAGNHGQAISYTGFTVIFSAAVSGGKIRVYGYKN